ncbi:hypothetical protein G6L37_06140 [Agrobacterium rubi]|nr:hypothetical protein [Agrobacterium rubi]NTF24941.1 hypothetical protein [Agrobacterium rubi]
MSGHDISAARVVKGIVLTCLFGWAIIGLAAAVSPDRDELEAREADAALTSFVANCVARDGPWRCFVSLEGLDRSTPISGETRLERMARMVPAWEVLAFCTERRKIDCADRMIGTAYSREQILEGMGE